MSRRRLRATITFVAGTVATAAALLVATPVIADCGLAPFPQQVGAYRGIAFVGTVTASEPVKLRYRQRRGSDEIQLSFAVERPIAGVDGGRISVIGADKSSCSVFWASELAVGDRVLISFQPPTDEDQYHLPQRDRIAWRALVWRPTGDGVWRFADDAMLAPEDHPDAARAADSLSEILALVGPDLPPTDVEPAAPAPGLTEGVLVLAGLAGAAITVRQLRRRVAP